MHTTPSETPIVSARRARNAVPGVLLGVLACVPIALFLITALGRLHCPVPLEQLEGPMLLGAIRAAHGQPIYAAPNFHFIPYMYAPGYYYVSGWAVRLLGPAFFPLRLVSLLSTLGAFGLIYLLVLLDAPGPRGRRHLAALVGAGLYAAMYPWTREWFDLARLDALYIFLLLLALLCTRKLHPILAAAAWTLVFLTKQTIFPVALILLCHDWKRPRRMLIGVGSFLAMAGGSFLAINHATYGWLRYFMFTVPHANSDLRLRPFAFFLPSQVIAPLGAGLVLIGLAWFWTRPKISERATRLYLLAGASTLALCWFLQAHAGATENTPMPLYAVLAVLIGLAIARLDVRLEEERRSQRWLVLAMAAVPLVSWLYSPHDFTPRRDLVEEHGQLLQWIQSFPGDVFLPGSPEAAVAAGKQERPDIAAVHDALRPGQTTVNVPLLKEIQTALAGDRMDAIAFDELPIAALAEQPWLPRDLLHRYPILGIIPGSQTGDRFGPHPTYFLLPCREQALVMAKGWVLLQSGGGNPCPQNEAVPDGKTRQGPR